MTKRSHLFWTENLGPYDNELALLFQKLSDPEGILNAEIVIREHLNAFTEIEKRELEAQQDEELSEQEEAGRGQKKKHLRYKANRLGFLELFGTGGTLLL